MELFHMLGNVLFRHVFFNIFPGVFLMTFKQERVNHDYTT